MGVGVDIPMFSTIKVLRLLESGFVSLCIFCSAAGAQQQLGELWQQLEAARERAEQQQRNLAEAQVLTHQFSRIPSV